MRPQASLVLLEFNELTPVLMERFISQGKLPNFQRLQAESQVFVSDAEEQEPYLEPWIQWVTVHTGLPRSAHGVFRLSEAHKLRQKSVWDLVSDAGQNVWVCGSMNARYEAGLRGYILPDPWSTDVEPYPEALRPYFGFIQSNVHEYTNDRVPLTTSDYLKFVQFMVANGLSRDTVTSIIGQLISEKRTGAGRWRRAFILEQLQFDLFSAVYRRLKPRLSTFFLNSTAHMQHRYWRFMQPELFSLPPDKKKQARLETAIVEGYIAMDRLLGKMLKLVGPDCVVILSTALGQEPCLRFEEAGGKRSYRPKDFDAVLRFAGLDTPWRVAPVMAEQFWVHLDNVSDAEKAESKLTALRIGDKRALFARRDGCAVFASCCIKHQLPEDATLSGENLGKTIPFFEMFYAMEGGKSGMHHPDGILWVRHPELAHTVYQERVPLLSVAPTILEALGIEQPEYMPGVSLLSDPTGAAVVANDRVMEREVERESA